jgi:hypothetical protein
VKMPSFWVSVHAKAWFSGNLKKESDVIASNKLLRKDGDHRHWDLVFKEVLFKVARRCLHSKNRKIYIKKTREVL